ncbi:hypothetical protein [Actinacidiphila glaucinigra]|uniref:hypothetical protein n=1 Tax=Actinacidiphila glaucinigra TaxID=235986 RepID=UPI0035D5EA52
MAIATAEDHNCTYCLSAHTCIGAGVTTGGARELPATRSADQRRHAAVSGPHIARGRIGETQLKAARAMGVTGAEIADLVGNPALNILTDYRPFLADTKTEWPLVTPHARA